MIAQDTGERTIRGSVRAAADSAPIRDAVIRTLGSPPAGWTTSSASGGFILRVPAGPLRLVALRIGFAPETVLVAGDQSAVELRLREAPIALDPILVSAEPAYSAASSRVVQRFDLELRPRETAQELLRLAPGLVIAQHAGGGKAEQIFLRGSDADHGTDVAISVDGTPVNLVSHGHGQGYADLHFLMPEVVDLVEARKGPYAPQDGNFATAGAVNIRTRDRLSRGTLSLRAGAFNTIHGLALVPFGGDATRAGGYVAGSGHFTDGPVLDPQRHERFNGFAKFTTTLGGTELAASASGLRSRWNASGQVPERAVRAGRIPRFGAIDPSEGGSTARYDVNLALRSSKAAEEGWAIRAYAARYHFSLFSNFTFFLVDSIQGDQIHQSDSRVLAGLEASYSVPSRILGMPGRATVGAGSRADFADVTLSAAVRRRLLERRVDARIREQHGFLWLAQELRVHPRLRVELGLRGDLFRFAVDDRISEASGARTAAILSPKANLALDLSRSVSLYANAGVGFHSNDARVVLQAAPGTRTLPRAFGAELGARYVWTGGSVAAALWGLDLQSELVYVGDEGTTEARGRSRRVGLDLEGRVRLTRWLWADADLNLARARFRDEPEGVHYLPLAPGRTASAGLTVRELGPVRGGLRVRHVAGRAADETNTVRARGYTLAEMSASWRLGKLELFAGVDNLFNIEWNEAQFATTSRLAEENNPVTELHFTPGPGRAVQLGAGLAF